jgi:rhomboid protease GluP
METQRLLKETYLSRKPSRENAVIGFIGVGLLTLVSLLFWSDIFLLSPYLTATSQQVFTEKEYWRLFTSLGAHANIQHLLSNSLGFFIFSYLLYDYFGSLVFPVAAVLLGALTSGISLYTYDPNVSLIGASGVVYLMVGIWLVLYALIERRLSVSARVLRLVGFALTVLMPSTFEKAISYRTHLIGLAIGLSFGFIYYAFNWRRFRNAEVWIEEPIGDLENDFASNA